MVRWRLTDLAQWVWDEFRTSISPQTLSPELRAMGYRKPSARPRNHAQAEGAAQIARDKSIAPDAIEIWFANEARVGQKSESPDAGRCAALARWPRTIADQCDFVARTTLNKQMGGSSRRTAMNTRATHRCLSIVQGNARAEVHGRPQVSMEKRDCRLRELRF